MLLQRAYDMQQASALLIAFCWCMVSYLELVSLTGAEQCAKVGRALSFLSRPKYWPGTTLTRLVAGACIVVVCA